MFIADIEFRNSFLANIIDILSWQRSCIIFSWFVFLLNWLKILKPEKVGVLDYDIILQVGVNSSAPEINSPAAYSPYAYGGGGVTTYIDIVPMCVPNSRLFQRCQVYGKPPFAKKNYMTGPNFHHWYMMDPISDIPV